MFDWIIKDGHTWFSGLVILTRVPIKVIWIAVYLSKFKAYKGISSHSNHNEGLDWPMFKYVESIKTYSILVIFIFNQEANWNYNYLCNQYLSPLNLWIQISIMARCTRYNNMWLSLSANYGRSSVFLGYSGFLHQYNFNVQLMHNILLMLITGARGTDHPPFSNFLFTNLFSIKKIISLLFHLFFLILTCSCQYSYNLMLTSNCMCRPYIDTNNPLYRVDTCNLMLT